MLTAMRSDAGWLMFWFSLLGQRFYLSYIKDEMHIRHLRELKCILLQEAFQKKKDHILYECKKIKETEERDTFFDDDDDDDDNKLQMKR